MERLRELRLKRGMTQKYVALTLGVKGPSVSNWESGKTTPTTENVAALAKLYNVSVDYLLGRDEGNGMRIRELRKAKKVTMKELGNMIGVAESTMSLYETGKRKPDPETLSRLADYFNVSVDYLLGRDEGQPQTAPKYSTDQRKEIVLKKLEKKSLAQLEAILVALGDDGK